MQGPLIQFSPAVFMRSSHFVGFLSKHSELSSVVDENTFVSVGCTVGASVSGLSVTGSPPEKKYPNVSQ